MEDVYRVPVTESDRIRAGLAMQLVAASTGVTAERMRQRPKPGDEGRRARRLSMYLAYVTFGWPLERVAHAFEVSRATATAGCRWVEDERDRPTLDALLDRLERCVREVLDAPACDLPA